MISFQYVYSLYKNHKVIAVQALWRKNDGWKDVADLKDPQRIGKNIYTQLEQDRKNGYEVVTLILQNKATKMPVWADFRLSELEEEERP